MADAPRKRSPDSPILTTLDAGTRLWRVSRDDTGLAFSSSARQNRFSAAIDPNVALVPVWYGVTSEAGAIFESVFHDIRPSHTAPRVMPNQYANRVLAPVVTIRALSLVDLTTAGLHAIGVSRARLIESTSRMYDWINEVAARLRAAVPTADGLVWVSRAHDTSRSIVLYAYPGRDPMLGVGPTGGPLPLDAGSGLALLRALAIPARITIVTPGP